MGNSVLGLLFQISADPSKAQEALAQFEKSTGTSLNQVVDHTEAMNKSLLNSHNSVHLLTEEMGIHLPRAVVGAVAEMLPHISDLGGALLGVFATKQLFDWSAAAADKIREVFTTVDQDIKDIDAAAAAAFKHAGEAATEMLTHFTTVESGMFSEAQIDARMADLMRYHKAFADLAADSFHDIRRLTPEAIAAIADATKEGLNDLESVNQKINEVGQLQVEAHKRMAEVTKKEDHARCEAAIADSKNLARANDLALDALFHHEAGLARMYQYQMHVFIELQKQAREQAGQIDTVIPRFQELIPTLDTYIDRDRQLVETTKHLNIVRREELLILQALHQAGEQEAKATMKDQLAATESLTAGLAGLIGGQRAAAAVTSIFDAAKGAEQVAMALDPMDPNHFQHWLSAGQFFVASAEFAKIAGTGSHHHGFSGGGGSFSGSRGDLGRGGSGGSGLDSGQAQPQTLAAGAASGQFGTAHVVVYSSDMQLAHFVGAAVNRAVESGFHVTATSSQRGAPVGH